MSNGGINNTPGLTGRDWYEDHVENFIRKNLGRVPNLNEQSTTAAYLSLLQKDTQACVGMIELWTEAKKRAKGKTILLPGRDTWFFELLARLEGTKTIFRPDISSLTCKWIAKFDSQREEFVTCYGLDSGNFGSIPKGLSCVDWGLVLYNSGNSLTRQLLPHSNNGVYYNCYCLLEGLNKYWTRATLSKGTSLTEDPTNIVIQYVKETENQFLVASIGTMILANYWLNSFKPVIKNPLEIAFEKILTSLSDEKSAILKRRLEWKAKAKVTDVPF